MIRSILWLSFVCLYLIASLPLFVSYLVLLLFHVQETADRLARFTATMWARGMIAAAGGRVKVIGGNDIPSGVNVCFVSNHQGYFDIPLIVGFAPTDRTVGFIAKKELRRIPIMNWWMTAIHCLFIDRTNGRAAARTIQRGVDSIKSGYPLVIFPEGTRSRGGTMGAFRSGSLKLATRSNSVIVPLTVNGTPRLWEKTKSRFAITGISLTVHPPIDTTTLTKEEKNGLAARLREIIRSGLEQTPSEPDGNANTSLS